MLRTVSLSTAIAAVRVATVIATIALCVVPTASATKPKTGRSCFLPWRELQNELDESQGEIQDLQNELDASKQDLRSPSPIP